MTCFMCEGTGLCQPNNDYCYGPDGSSPCGPTGPCHFCQPANGWFDGPSVNPPTRRPFEELIIELAERNGVPTWPVTSMNLNPGQGMKTRRTLKDGDTGNRHPNR